MPTGIPPLNPNGGYYDSGYGTGTSPAPRPPYSPVVNPPSPALPPPPPQGPQPGDVDPATGNRWSPGNGWLPANFFSDLNPGYQEGQPLAPDPYAGLPQLTPNVSGLATVPAGGPPPPQFPVFNPAPNTGNFYELPEAYQSFFPPDVLQALQGFLSGQGYQGTGNVGQFGERTWMAPSGATNPLAGINLEALMRFTQDSRIRNILQYLFGEQGVPTFNRIPRPTF